MQAALANRCIRQCAGIMFTLGEQVALSVNPMMIAPLRTLSLTNCSPNIVQRISSTSFRQSLLSLRVRGNRSLERFGATERILEWYRASSQLARRNFRDDAQADSRELLLLSVFSVFRRLQLLNLAEKTLSRDCFRSEERYALSSVEVTRQPSATTFHTPRALRYDWRGRVSRRVKSA